jgi:hypothetical protein
MSARGKAVCSKALFRKGASHDNRVSFLMTDFRSSHNWMSCPLQRQPPAHQVLVEHMERIRYDIPWSGK